MNMNKKIMLKLTDISTGKNDNDPPVDKVHAPQGRILDPPLVSINFRAASSTAY